MYDTLLFLHVISAAIAFITLAAFSAYALGARLDRPGLSAANIAWNVSGFGLFVFGIWLAIYVDGYEIWSGWIIIAILLLLAASETGRRAMVGAEAALEGGGSMAQSAVAMHWARTALVVLLLADMIWKPWAG